MIHPLHYSLVQCLGGESRVFLFTLASCHSPKPEKASEPKKFFLFKHLIYSSMRVFSNISISPTLNRKQRRRVKCLYFCLKKKHSSVVFPAKRADLQFTNLNWPFKATWKFHWWALVEYVLCSVLEQCKFLYFRLNSRAWTLVLEKKKITFFKASTST